PVCESCGTIAIYNEFKDTRFCPLCGDNVEITDVEISYAFKLILDEFKSLGIYPKMGLKTKY
ncbi:MAG: DNA-directed RNA polymerase subunit B, partial [Nanoarchaeota archaeon]|nr:DNA-directed RNA polymerase subunit B [Nanoarchaeota archaeon]